MKYILSFLLVVPLLAGAQSFPRNYFIPPLDTPLIITGSFGEIRSDHLHAGIDISTGDNEGLPVYSAGDGYISRVKIAPDGYGKAIYITHPNGYVSVYGHLQKFSGAMYGLTQRLQYERMTFDLDEKFPEGKYPVRQREVIAYSGSTGGAEGPHLHFEIRDEKTEEPLNPFLFGIPFEDKKPPIIKYVRIIPRPESGILNKTDMAESFELVPDEVVGWKLNVSDYPVVYGNISFAILTADSIDGYEGELNIYSAELFVDDVPTFTWRYDRLNFDYQRDVNAHIDYISKVRDQQVFEKFSRMPGDRLNIYGGDSLLTGNLNFDTDAAHNIRIVVRDFKGNMQEVKFELLSYVSAAENKYQPRNPDAITVTMAKGVAIHKSAYDVVIPEGAAYDDFYYDDEVVEEHTWSDVFRIGSEYIPLRKPISIGLKPYKEVSEELKGKFVVVRIGEYDVLKSLGGQWNGKFLTAKSNNFGRFTLMLDTVPPVVEKIYVPADMNSMYGGEVRMKVIDELSGIRSYSGKIDGKWRLFEYDKKNNMLVCSVDALMENKEHTIEVSVTDERGNTTVWKSSFYF